LTSARCLARALVMNDHSHTIAIMGGEIYDNGFVKHTTSVELFHPILHTCTQAKWTLPIPFVQLYNVTDTRFIVSNEDCDTWMFVGNCSNDGRYWQPLSTFPAISRYAACI